MDFDVFDFEEVEHKSGLRLCVKNLPWISGWLALRIIIRAGARYDPPGKEGLAHFFEHLPFEGSIQFPDSEIISQFDDEVFVGTLTGTTDLEGTTFGAKYLKTESVKAFKFFHDFVFHPLLGEEKIEREREIIIQEAWNKLGNQKRAELIRVCRGDVYREHPFSRIYSAVGWPETIKNINEDGLINFHQEFYHPANMMLVVVGDVSLSEISDLVDVFVEGAPASGKINVLPVKIEQWPKPRYSRFDVSEKDWLGLSEPLMEWTEFGIMRVLPKQRQTAGLSILGDMLYDLVFTKVREELLASYHISAKRDDFADHHLVGFELRTEPNKLEQVQNAMGGILAGFGADEYKVLFERKKELSIKSLKLADWTATGIANQAADELLNEGAIISYAETLKQRFSVVYHEICELVQSELEPELLYYFILRP